MNVIRCEESDTMGPGVCVAHYRITSKLGEGGMGEVWRATDTKLGRDVAIKVLPEPLAHDHDRMARFKREAQVLASLNHPNIAAIYGVEGGALILELVEGPTLEERIGTGPIPLAEALPIARQIAEATEYAHERGIIHRDLKPANIKVTGEGRAKVLDFGLAKALGGEAAAADASILPTITMDSTVAGVIMGTAAYMSPEQAKGKQVDRRADIWAFGVILTEMLTGRRLYQGDTVSETLAAILLKEPDLGRLPKDTPAPVRTLIGRCLDRDPLRRLRDIGEARIILEQPGWAAAEAAPRAGRAVRGWMESAVFAGMLVLMLYFRSTEQPRVVRLAVLPPPGVSNILSTGIPAISPDGRRLAFAGTVAGTNVLWVRDLDSTAAHRLPGTDGATFPFWSPDSRLLGFFADGKLKKIEPSGGLPVTLCDAPAPAGGSWSRSGVIVFAKQFNAEISQVRDQGGTPRPVTKLIPGDGVEQRYPWVLPDGRHFLYLSMFNEVEKSGIYLGSLDAEESRFLLPARSNAIYAPSGYLLYLRERSLMAQPFDAGRAQITGPAVPIATDIDSSPNSRRGEFSVSSNGVLVYISGSNGDLIQLTWFDRSGKQEGALGAPAGMAWPAISPDGNRVVVDQLDPETGAEDLWLHDVARGTRQKLTFNSKLSRYAVWSPDGSHIAFVSNRDGFFKIYQKAVSGAGAEEILHSIPPAWPDDWSRDGHYLVLEVPPGDTSAAANHLWVLPLSGDRKAYRYLQGKALERWGHLSPDGRWLAYSSDESGRPEIYITSFPRPAGKWQISIDGGDIPVWSRDGKNLFFLSSDHKMMAVEVNRGSSFEASTPQPLFDTHIAIGSQVRFDVGPDGRFLVPVQDEPAGGAVVTVVMNWYLDLKK